jgi:hypothetical protein
MSRAITLLPLKVFDFCYRVNFKLQLQCHEVPEPTKADSIGAEYQKQIQEIFLGATSSVLFKGRYLEVT